jgi:dienelactone hydrolase
VRVRAMSTATEGATKVTWTRDGTEVPGYVLGEAGKPGVICIQEWWGVEFEVMAHVSTLV